LPENEDRRNLNQYGCFVLSVFDQVGFVPKTNIRARTFDPFVECAPCRKVCGLENVLIFKDNHSSPVLNQYVILAMEHPRNSVSSEGRLTILSASTALGGRSEAICESSKVYLSPAQSGRRQNRRKYV
jgi:hypothetical protein